MQQVIIGTAGHVDHGKTRLVKALTGIETDRLKEEQDRGISIELGFAPLVLSTGQTVGLVDVPGHERFIKQMLAGAAGIDLALLVIAADEGVMPQTREHLDIIHLLQIKQGIIVLTKKDLVDNEWLEIMELEVRDAVQGTVLKDAPMIAVSAITGEGIEDLKKLIAEVVVLTQPRTATGKSRLPIDRVFSINGFGTVVTGTLWTGTIHLGDNVEILPRGIKTKVRSLQVHGQKKESAQAGQRVAINVAGVEVDDIEKGSVLAAQEFLKHTYRFDAKVMLLPHAVKVLKNLDRVRVYLGTKEVLGKVRMLDRDEMELDSEAFVQLYLEKPLVAARGDRFIIRTYSPMHTIAGGTIIDLLPPKHKRYEIGIIENMLLKEKGDPKELLIEYLDTKTDAGVIPKTVARDLNFTENEITELLETLIPAGEVIILGKTVSNEVVSKNVLHTWLVETKKNIESYQHRYPLRWGMPKEELRSRLFSGLDFKTYGFLLEKWHEEHELEITELNVTTYGWKPQLSQNQREIIDGIAQKIKMAGLQPQNPSTSHNVATLPENERVEMLNYLLNSGLLIKGEEDMYFHKDIINDAISKITSFAKENKGITLAEARDLLGATRKYILPILEYMDEKKLTRRIGDKRIILSAR